MMEICRRKSSEMKRTFIILFVIAVCNSFLNAQALENKTALVIGNSEYRHFPKVTSSVMKL